jgi:hypothetical protein
MSKQWIRGAFLMLVVAGWIGCGSDDEGGGAGSIAGRYFGDFAFALNDSSKSIFTAADLQIGSDGNVAGSKVTTTSPTSVVNEVGVVTGSVLSVSEVAAQADLTIVFPTLGTFTSKGSIVYASVTRSIGGQLPTRDAQGSIVGSVLLSLTQE